MSSGFQSAPVVTIEEAFAALRAGGATLVTASRRLARSLRQRYNAELTASDEVVWTSPAIVPWSAWLETLWEQRLYRAGADTVPMRLSAGQEALVWERVVRENAGDEYFLSIESTADAARQSWALMHAWELNRAEIEQAATEDTGVFLTWCDAFEHACAAGGWLGTARLPARLAESLGDVELPRRILLAGFDDVTPQQLSFAAACAASGALVDRVETAAATRGEAVRVACGDARQEIRAAAAWARATLEAHPEASIGVIVPDLETRRNDVERIFTGIFHPAAVLPGVREPRRAFNLSAGARLLDYPIVRAAFLALSLDIRANEIGELGSLLRSRYIGGAESERSARAVLDVRLRRIGAPQPPVDLVRRTADQCSCPALSDMLSRWREKRASIPREQRASAWAGWFSLLLDALGWPGDRPLDSGDYQVSRQWSELLSTFAALDGVEAIFTYREALGRLRRMASGEMFQSESEPAPVQVLGALEAAGARFDFLWISGMDDEKLPGPARPDPFLPVSVQRAQGVAHASPERELEFAQRRVDALFSSAPSIVVSHAQSEGGRPLAPSPLILAIPAAPLEASPFEDYAAAVRASAALEEFVDRSGPPVAGGGIERGGTNLFRYQALCPFRAFAELRLGAVALETPEDGLGKRDRGTLVHRALENIWKALKSHQRLAAVSEAELREAIAQAVSDAIRRMKEKRGDALAPQLAALEQERVEALVAEWLEIEMTRPPFTVVKPEGERMVEINGLRVSVRIDRVDRLADGRDVIIDYKTGDPKPAEWTGERPGEPQVPLYAITHPGPVAGAAFARIKAGKLAFKGLGEEPLPAPGLQSVEDMEAQLGEWRAVLERLAGDYRQGRADVDPKNPQSCRNCELAMLCRINDAELATSAFEGEDN